MLSIFSTNKKILGLDITEEYIRYSLVLKSSKRNILLSCGEEKIPRVEPRNALLSALRNVIRKTGCKDANVSFPADFVRPETVSVSSSLNKKDILHEIELRLKERNSFSFGESVLFYEKFESLNNKDFYNVFISSSENSSFLKSAFINSGLRVHRLIGRKDCLVSAGIKPGELENIMIVNLEYFRTDIAIFSPFNRFKELSSVTKANETADLIKDAHMDFYKISSDKINNFLISGRAINEINFINSISRQTRLPFREIDPLVNFYFKKGSVPPITKEESFIYALSLGCAIN